jgi:hypothetical protein
MLASATAIWVIVIVVVLCLSGWLSAVALAARRPYWKNAPRRPMIGPVVGGIHYADGGRSVSPDPRAPMQFTDEEEREIRRASRDRTTTRPHVPGQPVPAQRTGVRADTAAAGAARGEAASGGTADAGTASAGTASGGAASGGAASGGAASGGTAADTGATRDAGAAAGAGAVMGPGADGAAGAGSGAERQPVDAPPLPTQREATQDQPEHHHPERGA